MHKHKAVKSAVTHTPATKLFQKVHNLGASATKKGLVKASKKTGRDHLLANLSAEGAYSVCKKDPLTNRITNYETYIPNANPNYSEKWEFVRRYDASNIGISKGKGHYNKILKQDFLEPQVHDPYCPGLIRDVLDWEKPFNYN